MQNKGKVTSLIAGLMALCGVGLVVSLIIGKIDKETFTIAMVSVATFGSTLIGYFAKDKNQTHSKP
jgi:hypothetical protein